MAVQSFYLLPTGLLTIDRSILISSVDIGRKIKVPVYAVLLMHDEGPILIDLGLNPEGLINPEKAWGPRAKLIKPEMTEQSTIESHLNTLNIRIKDIRMVILTHMHWDHTGSLRYFDHCPIVVQKSEYRFAFQPDAFASGQYMNNHFNFPLQYDLIEGDRVLLPGVSVVRTSGHTPGHQSVIIRLKSGKYHIITGDALSTLENMRLKIPGSNVWDAQLAAESIYRIEHLSLLLNADVFTSHEDRQWDDFKKIPACYS
ncbi:MAG: N-acyl homoserine lactonase family protein [Deltaproteobacteria bacterium]|nr:N-acyl homoserine lactonase family protein [Deltaproteobacteria bacterium]